ncbi:SHOCT domain-containing protein [Marinomonas algicola]|uniref:SHOCT domain-containing protein n=1 Tax=Marinomonas algicola TaxID=2773454 RepID=UPI0017483E67|nr:SHOCT domain-containing protein [Marinomonas algicola]
MQNLTPQGQQLINDLSQRYNLSYDAVLHMLIAVNNGGCTMAQFSCPELGGSGQWMRGGMTMVGDMFNNGLKMTVDNLCNDLANALSNSQIFAPLPIGSRNSNQWWPQDLGLGQPFSSGAQNNIRYAVFPNRLAVEVNGQVTVYDTLDNNIGGVSQQQGGNDSLTFSSQYGTIAVNSLPVVSGSTQTSAPTPPPQNNFLDTNHQPSFVPQNNHTLPQPNTQGTNSLNSGSDTSVDNIIGLIEKLAKLRDAGAISENDYNNKKAELLNRI